MRKILGKAVFGGLIISGATFCIVGITIPPLSVAFIPIGCVLLSGGLAMIPQSECCRVNQDTENSNSSASDEYKKALEKQLQHMQDEINGNRNRFLFFRKKSKKNRFDSKHSRNNSI